jgi:O-antigen ligase
LFEGKELRLPSVPMLALLPFFTWCVLSIIWSSEAGRTSSVLLRMANLVFFLWTIWEYCRTRGEFLWMMRSYLWGHVVPFYMIARNRTAVIGQLGDNEILRATGGGHDQNYLSALMVIGMLMSVYLFSIARVGTWYRWLYIAFIALAVPSVFLTGSRAGFVGLLMVVVWTMIYLGARGRIVISFVGLIVACFIGYFVAQIIVPAATLARVIGTENYQGAELRNRFDIWETGYAAFQKRPLEGVGLGMFYTSDSNNGGRKTVAHNILISIFVELGAIGLLLYLTMLTLLVRAVWQLPRQERILWLGILTMWMVFSLTGGSGVDKLTWFVTAMAMNVAGSMAPVVQRRGAVPRVVRAAGATGRLSPGGN